jgi:hypothetical protein
LLLHLIHTAVPTQFSPSLTVNYYTWALISYTTYEHSVI